MRCLLLRSPFLIYNCILCQDSDIVKWLQNSLKQQQKAVDQLELDVSGIAEDNRRKLEDISRLNASQKRIEINKADKDDVERVVSEVWYGVHHCVDICDVEIWYMPKMSYLQYIWSDIVYYFVFTIVDRKL